MLQPAELKKELQINLSNGVVSTTGKVWETLFAAYSGDIKGLKKLAGQCRELLYAQYNYAPPIHLAVREGHIEIVEFLLANGAYDPAYKTYAFGDTLESIAKDRGHFGIFELLNKYRADPPADHFRGDNGAIDYNRSIPESAFEHAVDSNNLAETEKILKDNTRLAMDESFFWGEGILMMPAKENQQEMIDLLFKNGAETPAVAKWAQFYYFEHDEGIKYMLDKGMSPDMKNIHGMTILHDMAQKNNIQKASLLLKYGADIDAIDEEYRSTPLGIATRWENIEMVKFLISHGADKPKAGDSWARPLSWAIARNNSELIEIFS